MAFFEVDDESESIGEHMLLESRQDGAHRLRRLRRKAGSSRAVPTAPIQTNCSHKANYTATIECQRNVKRAVHEPGSIPVMNWLCRPTSCRRPNPVPFCLKRRSDV